MSYGYGIPIDDKGLRPIGEPVIDDVEAAVVLRILRQYVEDRTPREIAHQINPDHIPCPGLRERGRTPAWNRSMIQGNRERGASILNNELHRWVRVWKRL